MTIKKTYTLSESKEKNSSTPKATKISAAESELFHPEKGENNASNRHNIVPKTVQSQTSASSNKIHSSTPLKAKEATLKPKNPTDRKTTKITVRYDVGFHNTLFLRGKGPNLSWDKGTPLKNIKHDEWVWESEHPFQDGEFKVLINDLVYEKGDNHTLISGANVSYSPMF